MRDACAFAASLPGIALQIASALLFELYHSALLSESLLPFDPHCLWTTEKDSNSTGWRGGRK